MLTLLPMTHRGRHEDAVMFGVEIAAARHSCTESSVLRRGLACQAELELALRVGIGDRWSCGPRARWLPRTNAKTPLPRVA
jgi:hypothetical protein